MTSTSSAWPGDAGAACADGTAWAEGTDSAVAARTIATTSRGRSRVTSTVNDSAAAPSRPRWGGSDGDGSRGRIASMRATTIHAPGDIRFEEVPDPTIEEPTDAIIK